MWKLDTKVQEVQTRKEPQVDAGSGEWSKPSLWQLALGKARAHLGGAKEAKELLLLESELAYSLKVREESKEAESKRDHEMHLALVRWRTSQAYFRGRLVIASSVTLLSVVITIATYLLLL